MLVDLATHMSREDLRLRFFTTVPGLTHAVAARLSPPGISFEGPKVDFQIIEGLQINDRHGHASY